MLQYDCNREGLETYKQNVDAAFGDKCWEICWDACMHKLLVKFDPISQPTLVYFALSHIKAI